MNTKNFNKKSIFAISALLILLVAILIAIAFNGSEKEAAANGNIPTSEIVGSYIIDVDSKPELVGDADYVFVGAVVSEDGTVYEGNSPYTDYTVRVIKNIKGEIVTDREIPVQKSGGLAQDGSQYLVFEKDELPEAGSIYIFYAYAQTDGSLLVCGPNSNEKIDIVVPYSLTDDSLTESIEATTEFQEVVDAFKVQVERDRERDISTYDANN